MNDVTWHNEWARWLAQCGLQAGYGQTPTWARLREITIGAKAHLAEVRRDGQRVAGALLLHRSPQVSDHLFLRAVKYGVLECVHGPVLPADASELLLAALIDQIERVATRLRVSRVEFISRPAAAIWSESLNNVFVARGYARIPLLTSVVDLTSDEATLFASFEHAARKGVRKCEKSGLRVQEIRDWRTHREEFLAPFYASSGHESLIQFSDHIQHRKWVEEIGSGLHRFFVARVGDGPVLATLGTYSFNGLVTEIMSGRTSAGPVSDLPSQDFLHWQVFKAHKAAGDMLFDMAGFSAAPASSKEAGIRRFKEKWGGRTVEVPSYHRDLPTMANRAFGVGRAIKRLVSAG